MAYVKRFLKPGQSWRSLSARRTLASSSSATPDHQNHLHRQFFEHQVCCDTSKFSSSTSSSKCSGMFSLASILFGGLLGAGSLSYADADAKEDNSQSSPLPESPSSLRESSPVLPESPPPDYVDVEKVVKQERKHLEDLLKSSGMGLDSYPRFTVAMKGQKVSIKFQVPRTCDTAQLIVDLASNLGSKSEQRSGSSVVTMRAWNSAVAWQLTLRHPDTNKGDLGGQVLPENKDGHEGSFCVLIFQSLISADTAEIEFIKQGSFTPKELDALVSALKLAGGKMAPKRTSERRPQGHLQRRETKPDIQKSLASLEAIGVRIFGLNETHEVSKEKAISWDNIAGYDQQKREIEDTILLALHRPEVYDDIARGTRHKFESNRPRAVLFEGPPGTGKTSCARVIANQAGVPLLYVPLEAVMSKYYGESERLFGTVFSLANGLPDGAIIFLDEIDSFAAARDEGMHEATRRVLSVLLRQIDGFEQEKQVVVIAATNRKEDLDPALISRFDSMITFGLPDQKTRQEICAQYAKHLNKSELVDLAAVTEEMSGRDIRDVCQQAERRWASKIIRGQGEKGGLPPLQEYIDSAAYRGDALLSVQAKKSGSLDPKRRKSRPLELA